MHQRALSVHYLRWKIHNIEIKSNLNKVFSTQTILQMMALHWCLYREPATDANGRGLDAPIRESVVDSASSNLFVRYLCKAPTLI